MIPSAGVSATFFLSHKAIKRRTRVATLFPNEASLLRLASAVFSEISDDWDTEHDCLNVEARCPTSENPGLQTRCCFLGQEQKKIRIGETANSGDRSGDPMILERQRYWIPEMTAESERGRQHFPRKA